jgi:hypothetical protein
MTDKEIEQRANMLANANQYVDVAPTPLEINARTEAALNGLSLADVDRVRLRAYQIGRARLMSRL